MTIFAEFEEFGEHQTELSDIASQLETFLTTSGLDNEELADVLEHFRDVLDILADKLEASEEDDEDEDDENEDPKEDLGEEDSKDSEDDEEDEDEKKDKDHPKNW